MSALVQEFRDAGLEVECEIHGSTHTMSSHTGLGVYRIVQESLANVAKHQPAATARVVLEFTSSQQRLTVWSTLPPDGSLDRHAARSGSQVSGTGSGLNGMRQRAELLGGSFTARNARRPLAGRSGPTRRPDHSALVVFPRTTDAQRRRRRQQGAGAGPARR